MQRCAKIFTQYAVRRGLIACALLAVTTGAAPREFVAPAGSVETFENPRGAFGWYVLNDNVMGGRSRGDFAIDQGELRFRGATNTNGGGFSSLRTEPLALDLSQSDGVELTLLGDGRRYTWRLTTDATWRGRPVAYWAQFDTVAGQQQTVRLGFDEFVPRFRGAQLPGPALNRARITGMGIMIYDGRDGAFSLTLNEVGVYAQPFSLAALRGVRRVLILNAPSAEDPAAQQQLQAIAATSDAFFERDMQLVVLTDDGSTPVGFRAVEGTEQTELRRDLKLTSGAFGLRLIGKDGSLKRSDDAPVAMERIYAQIDGMPMRRREMRERSSGL